ncbi:DMBT1 protein, partial [Rynchops niger]|nr:DMBT1 protein [Rynchops niger]
VRLAGGPGRCAGRVEVQHDGRWGTVCDDDWGLPDAAVVCRQLGCGAALAAPPGAWFGEGSGPIWLNGLRCRGTEERLVLCRHRGWRPHVCAHEEDASAVCSGAPTVRLVGATGRCAGRLEIFHDGHWGTVCDDLWGLPDAAVVCRQLGCGAALDAPRAAFFGEGTGPIWLDDVRCQGNESSLLGCPASPWGLTNCQHREDAAVVCAGSFPVRLAGGPGRCAGRVEVQHDGRWGTVCDDDWGLPDAAVVCRQLGCGAALAAPPGAWFGEGSGPIWLNGLRCRGTEERLVLCRHRGWRPHVCAHEEDASAVCSGAPTVRLVGATGRCAGRLEIFHDGHWGTVCDDLWGLPDAAVVCRQLGCGAALDAPRAAFFGEGTGPIWLDDVRCQGNESSLLGCPASPWGLTNCQHREDAAVVCAG